MTQFADVTATVGLDGYIASTGDGHGPGAVFADLDNDGYSDLYLVRAGEPNLLFLNRDQDGQRVFEQAAGDAGAGHPGPATGAIAGDYDNDGDLDLFVVNFDDDNALLQNQLVESGFLQFVDVTAQTDPTPDVADGQFGLRTATWDAVTLEKSLTAAWGDPDRDGDLDLYVGNHHEWLNSPALQTGEVAGQRDIFYLNNGDGTFTDVTMELDVPGFQTADGLYATPNQSFSSTNAIIFADFDNDQWPDLLVTNKVGGSDDREMLYLNQGANESGVWRGFSTETYELPTPFGHLSGGAMGVSVADLEHDGDLDIYITDWSSASRFDDRSSGRNDIWINQLSETGQLDFVHNADATALFSWGVQWEDFDNNGFQDLHVATHRGASDFFYANSGGVLTDESATAGFASEFNARGDVSADYDRDGWLDLFVVNIDDSVSHLYQNRSASEYPERHFLSLKLIGNPELPGPLRSTRDAIGARVVVRADIDGDGTAEINEKLTREVQSGSSNAASTSSLEVEFGLGLASQADVWVYWPSGRITELGPIATDDFLTVHERQTTVGKTAASTPVNLLQNPGFEHGLQNWFPLGSAVVNASQADVHSGSQSALVTDRSETWHGIAQSLLGVMEPGGTYQVSAWVKLQNGDNEPIGLTIQLADGSGTSWHGIQWDTGWQDEWVLLIGSFTLEATGPIELLQMYVEGPAAGVDLLVDSLSVARLGGNLIQNPGFEAGTSPWVLQGDVSLEARADAHTGFVAGHVTGRTAAWNGVGQSLIGLAQPGITYQISVWVKLDGVDGENIGLTLQQIDDSGTKWTPIEWTSGSQSEWQQLSGSYTLDVLGSLTTLFLYVEGPNAGVDFFIDDLSVEVLDPEAWKAAANERIEQLRKRDARITVLDAGGNPIPGVSIDVTQVRHGFGLGTTINSSALTNPLYVEFLRENFEWGVPEFEAKWHQTEQVPGSVNYDLADSIVAFAQENGMALRGHTIFWGVEQFVPSWVRSLSGAQLRSAIDSRLESVLSHFQGDFHHWDVNNEMLHGSFYEDRLPGIRTSMFQQAKAADPDVQLFVNDYEIISGGLAESYKALIQELISDGAPVDGIGVQGHFPSAPSAVSPTDVLARLDVLGPLGLPIWITEFDVQDPDVESRADQLEAVYRAVFSHPAVDGILMWGFWAGAHWRGENAALVELDGTVNAAGHRYQDLVAEWTTSVQGSTDPSGEFEFRGFHGSYDIAISVPGQAPTVHSIVLPEGAGTHVATLNLAFSLPEVALTTDQPNIPESGGTSTFTATLSTAAELPVTVDLNFTGTASEDDYSASGMQIVIPPGESTGSISIVAVDDSLDEADETVIVGITKVVGSTVSGVTEVSTTIVDDDAPPSFRVASLTPTSSGFVVEFNDALERSLVNLYHGPDVGPPDLVLQGEASGRVDGALVVDASNRMVTFIKSGGPLQPDRYSITLRSGADAFATPGGFLLDGDGDGIAGDDMTEAFTVAAPADGAITISLPDFVRGPGQSINLPAATGAGIPLSISDGARVRTIQLQLRYDPTLIEVNGVTVSTGMPAGTSLVWDVPSPGLVSVILTASGGLPAGAIDIVSVIATVPATNAQGVYGSQGVLDIQEVSITGATDNQLPVIVDDAFHLASFFGDVSGNGRLNAADAAQVARVAALIDRGFDSSRNVDPAVVGDISGNGRVNAADASLLARFVALFEVPQIPALPGGAAAAELPAIDRQGLPTGATVLGSSHTASSSRKLGTGLGASIYPARRPPSDWSSLAAVDNVIVDHPLSSTGGEQLPSLSLEDAIAELVSNLQIQFRPTPDR